MIGDNTVDLEKALAGSTLEDLKYFPKYFQIETISACNARCTMCSVDSWVRTKSAMSSSLFNKIVNEIGSYAEWIERVVVQQDGEPLLDKHLEEKIRTLKSKGIRHVSFATNASLLTNDRSASLIASGLDSIDFSIDGNTRDVFEKIRINLDFETCRENILHFLSLRDRTGRKPQVRLRMCIQQSNVHEFRDFVDYWRPRLAKTDTVFGKIEQSWSGWEKEVDKSVVEKWGRIRQMRDINSKPCISPFDTFVILCDGRVALCCLDYNASVGIGNVNDFTIKEVWENSAFDMIRQSHLVRGRGSMDICRDCHNFSEDIKFVYPGIAG